MIFVLRPLRHDDKERPQGAANDPVSARPPSAQAAIQHEIFWAQDASVLRHVQSFMAQLASTLECRRNALAMTLTEDKAMAAPAMMAGEK